MKLHPTFMRPAYEGPCFVNIPRALPYLLTGSGQPALPRTVLDGFEGPWKRVICFFIDALGWRFIEPRLDDYGFLKEVVGSGRAAQLTSQFPSTTAAHMTAFHTGLSPAQSGVYEWNYVDPHADALICPLPCITARGHTPLTELGVDIQKVYPNHTIYQELDRLGVASTLYLDSSICDSTYSQVMTRGGARRPFRSIPECLINAGDQLRSSDRTEYINVYIGDIDATCHNYGPGSAQLEAEIDAFLTLFERLFLKRCLGSCPDTLLLMTADHGQIDVSPARTFYLNTRVEGIEAMIERTSRGELKAPVGSPRDLFIQIREEQLDEALGLLSKELEGIADVVRTEALVEQGYFGLEEPSEALRSRLTNLVILPYGGEAVWWYEEGVFEQKKYGHHGGLTPEEMQIPLLMLDLG